MNFYLTLKGHFENLIKVKVMTWPEKVMLHVSRFVSSAWARLRCFHRSSLSVSKAIAEKLLMTFRKLKWPRGYEEGLMVAIFRFSVSILPGTRCLIVFRTVFVQKKRLSTTSYYWKCSWQSACRWLISLWLCTQLNTWVENRDVK